MLFDFDTARYSRIRVNKHDRVRVYIIVSAWKLLLMNSARGILTMKWEIDHYIIWDGSSSHFTHKNWLFENYALLSCEGATTLVV